MTNPSPTDVPSLYCPNCDVILRLRASRKLHWKCKVCGFRRDIDITHEDCIKSYQKVLIGKPYVRPGVEPCTCGPVYDDYGDPNAPFCPGCGGKRIDMEGS